MTQLAPPRIPRFHSGSLPDPITLPDTLIVAEGFDGSHTLMKSDGVNWVAVGSLIAAIATQAQAIAGTDDTTVITPLKLAEVLAAFGIGGASNTYVDAGYVDTGYVN